MPSRQLISNQTGSILATVMGLSLVLTAAATGYLAYAANSAASGSDDAVHAQTFHAAESGLHLGVRWCKAFHYTKYSAQWADDLTLTRTPLGSPGWAEMDGARVLVVFDRPGDGIGGHNWLTSYATMGDGRDTVKLSMQIDGADDGTGGDAADFGQYIKLWTDSLFPGR